MRNEGKHLTFTNRSRSSGKHRNACGERDDKHEAAGQRFREEALTSHCRIPHLFQRGDGAGAGHGAGDSAEASGHLQASSSGWKEKKGWKGRVEGLKG